MQCPRTRQLPPAFCAPSPDGLSPARPCCPRPGTAQTARPVRCRQAVLVLQGQLGAAHACVLRRPAACISGDRPHLWPHSSLRALFSLSAMSFRAPCPLRPVSLSGDPGAGLGKKRPCPASMGRFPHVRSSS
ncbi:hypothetical protein DESPIG_00052 [Desulfovibrio piger ATCC 29098]|uniref:Uncharacterized protein n=1 Tax=Desulfovibrio piger ATCC 29098 TaxID=411464 RepID=B6WPT7_9BACT|nr:hypothetical protein DESPIG_00052 [Desulfovibrio piger ATCC 29098]